MKIFYRYLVFCFKTLLAGVPLFLVSTNASAVESTIPEPSTIVLLGAGAVVAVLLGRIKRKK